MTYPNGKTESLLPRRLAIMDIETTSLDAMTGRVCVIGLLFDNAVNLQTMAICEQDEKKLLERFWASITENDLLIGHNILEFDLMFIRQRSWILGVKPPIALNLRKYYTETVVDLMQMWLNWSNKRQGAGLDNIAQALGLPGKTGHGSEVAEMWARGEYIKVMDYCMSDVWLSYFVFCKMHYREPLGAPIPKAIAPEREPVYVLQQQKGPEALQTLQAPALVAAFPTPSVPQEPAQNEKREMFFETLSTGRVRIFGPGFFLPGLKDTLKKIYRLKGHKLSGPDEKPQRWEWTMDQSNLQSLSELCVARGIQFQRVGNGTLSLPRGA